MNKKGILGLIIIIILGVAGYVIFGGSSTSSVSNTGTSTETPTNTAPVSKDTFAPVTKDSTDVSLLGRLKNASVSAAETGTRVALSGGSAKFSDGDVKGTITLGDIAVETTASGSKYVLASLAVNSGGSGTFKYVVLFEDKNGTLTDKSYAIVGDRVNVTGIRADVVSDTKGVQQVVVSVSYLDHDKGEALASTPTVPRTKIFVVEGGEFNSAKELTL
ncbi:MAG: hypothetical protein RLZZ67_253 [Candidatus Parcubacteria bacterium]|jgi:hypothetical protein